MNDIAGTVTLKADGLEFLISGLRSMAEYQIMSFEQLQDAVLNFCELACEQVKTLRNISNKTAKVA